MAAYTPIKKQEIFRIPNSSYPSAVSKPAEATPVVVVEPATPAAE